MTVLVNRFLISTVEIRNLFARALCARTEYVAAKFHKLTYIPIMCVSCIFILNEQILEEYIVNLCPDFFSQGENHWTVYNS